jgi:hypothetical protein
MTTHTTRRRLAALVVTAAALAAPAAAAATSPPTGDWEASAGNGALASFEIAKLTTHPHGHVSHSLAVEDFVAQAPIGCQNAASSSLPVDVDVVSAAIPLTTKNAFASGAIKRAGSATAIHATFKHGRFAISYRHVIRQRNLYEGGESVCDTHTIHLTAERGHRRALKEGIWGGQTTLQEPVELNVVAGGRALVNAAGPGPGGAKEYAFAIAPSNGNDACSYDVNFPMFIGSDGSFSNALTHRGDEAVLSGRFTKANAITGGFSNLEESCPEESWSAKWSFSPKQSG